MREYVRVRVGIPARTFSGLLIEKHVCLGKAGQPNQQRFRPVPSQDLHRGDIIDCARAHARDHAYIYDAALFVDDVGLSFFLRVCARANTCMRT